MYSSGIMFDMPIHSELNFVLFFPHAKHRRLPVNPLSPIATALAFARVVSDIPLPHIRLMLKSFIRHSLTSGKHDGKFFIIANLALCTLHI